MFYKFGPHFHLQPGRPHHRLHAVRPLHLLPPEGQRRGRGRRQGEVPGVQFNRHLSHLRNLRLELGHRLRQGLRTHLGTRFLVVG